MNFQAISLQNHPEWSMIRIKAPESDARTPVHLCCVIDVSASMSAEYKLENVKSSLGFLLDFLGANDTISIITFSDKAKVIVNRVRVTNDEKENIRARISLINTISNTNLSDGIIAAHECLDINTDVVKQGILLLTDGVANMGVTRTPKLLELVHSTTNKFPGTTISCIGYGTSHNVDLLRSISAESGGTYYVVNNLEDVAAVFGDVLGALVSCSYQRLRIVLPGGTEVKTRYGVETIAENDGGRVEVIIGDLPAGMEAVVLAKAAIGTHIGLKGFDLQDHTTFAIGVAVTEITNVEDEEIQTAGEAHYLRFEVLELVEGARTLLANATTTSERFAEEVVRIDASIARITEYSATHAHTLWDVLLEELRTCKNMIQTHRRGDLETTQVLGQRTMYLANMRGIAATCSQRAETDSPAATAATAAPPSAPRLRSTFSNALQNTFSSQLQTSCTPIATARRERDTPAPLPLRHSRSVMMQRQYTDPIGLVTRGIGSRGESESDSDSDDLMPYLYTVGSASTSTLHDRTPYVSVPSSHQDDIKRITINLSHNISPPDSPSNSPVAKGGAGV